MGFECGQSVSYSRNKNFYANSQRYRGTSYSYRSMLGTIAEIGDAGLILDCRVPQGNLGWQSSFQATGRLIEVWLATRQRLEYIQSEIIELKNNAGALIDYPETALTYRMRSELAERNEALAAVQISVPDAERHGRHLLFRSGKGLSYVLPIPGNGLVRKFNRGSYGCHGRAYACFPSIPRSARSTMTLNGEGVAELDYRALHITMLYNRAGEPIGDNQPYKVACFERDHVKLAVNISLNAHSEREAESALAHRLGCDRRHASNVIAAVKQRHKPIERYFGADAGIGLMRRDSDLILAALKAANDSGIDALPVHDALIVPARAKDRAISIMEAAFDRVIGGPNRCRVTVKTQHQVAA